MRLAGGFHTDSPAKHGPHLSTGEEDEYSGIFLLRILTHTNNSDVLWLEPLIMVCLQLYADEGGGGQEGR